jgi:CheY-like chemotaxis protein
MLSLAPINNPSVLLVEDEENLRGLLAMFLERAAYRVTAVDNGRAALRHMSEEAFDVIVTDVLMPDTDGLEVITAAKQLQPNAAIIAMSGGSDSLSATFCLRLAGALSHGKILMKPFSQQQFLEAIANLKVAAA